MHYMITVAPKECKCLMLLYEWDMILRTAMDVDEQLKDRKPALVWGNGGYPELA